MDGGVAHVWYRERFASTQDALIYTGFVGAVFMCSFSFFSLSLYLVLGSVLVLFCRSHKFVLYHSAD